MRLAARGVGAARWMAGAERAAGAAIRGDGRAVAAIRGGATWGAGRAMAGAGRATGAGRAMAAGAGRGGGAARAAGAGAAGRAGAAAGAAFLGGSANASPIVAVIIEIARTLAAQPALHRSIVLNSHVNSHVATRCNARAVAWFLRPSYRGTDPWWICVRTVHQPFIVDASPLRQKETRVLNMRLGWSGLRVLLGAAQMQMQSERAH